MLGDGPIFVPEQREARLEVHVDDEPEPRHQPYRAEQIGDAGIAPARIRHTEEAEGREDQRQGHHADERQRARPLPRAVLEIVDELLGENGRVPTRIAGAREIERMIENAPATELLAPNHREQIPPGLRIRLIEDRLQTGTDIKESVDRDANGGDAEGDQWKGPRSRHPAGHRCPEHQCASQDQQHRTAESHRDQGQPHSGQRRPFRPFRMSLRRIERGRRAQRVGHEHRDSRPHEQREQMVPNRERRDINDQQQDVRRLFRPAQIPPTQAQPADRGDAERRDRIDLGLVAVLPFGECECREECGGGGPADAQPPCFANEQPLRDEEETARTPCRETRAHQIGPPRVLAEHDKLCPHVAEQHEQRRPRRMRDAQHLGRCNEFARIPQRDGGRERDYITKQYQERDGCRFPIGRMGLGEPVGVS